MSSIISQTYVITSTTSDCIANLVVDSITLMVTALVIIPTLVVYFKRDSYLICKSLMETCNPNQYTPDSRTKSRGFFFCLMNSLLSFLIFRILIEGLTIAQHTQELRKNVETYVLLLNIRRILDYVGMYWFLTLFTLIIPIWMKVCITWISTSRNRKIMQITIGILLILVNVLGFFGFLPVAVLSIISAVDTNFESNDLLRKILTYGIGTPLVGISTAIVFFLSIGVVVMIVIMLRNASKKQPDNSEQYQIQKQAIVKLTVGVIVLAAAVLIETIGVAVNGASLPNYIVFPLAKGVPYIFFALCVDLIFWPFPLPILSQPVQFVMQELKFSTIVNLPTMEKKKKLAESTAGTSQSTNSDIKIEEQVISNHSSNTSESNQEDIQLEDQSNA